MNIALEIEDVAFAQYVPQFARLKCRSTGAQKAGKRYEAQALQYLSKTYANFIPLPWLMYKLKGEDQYRFCQPDGIIVDFLSGYVWVIECKIKHVSIAITKLRDLYLPLLRELFPKTLWKLIGVEFTRSFDCAVKVPVKECIVSFDMLLPKTDFGIMVWTPPKKLH